MSCMASWRRAPGKTVASAARHAARIIHSLIVRPRIDATYIVTRNSGQTQEGSRRLKAQGGMGVVSQPAPGLLGVKCARPLLLSPRLFPHADGRRFDVRARCIYAF